MPADKIEQELLYNIARNSKDSRAVEIGCLFGEASTLAIIKGLSERYGDDFSLVCIDPFLYIHPDRGYPAPEFFKNIYATGKHKNVTFYKGLSSRAHAVLGNDTFGFAYIDGDHRVLPTLSDLLMCAMRTNTIALHDYYSETHREVNIAVDFFKEHSGWQEVDRANMIIVLHGDYIMGGFLY